MFSLASNSNPEHIVIYDPVHNKPLLVAVASPAKVKILPDCPAQDYFIQKHSVNHREFVSSPSLGQMFYVAW